ncbi:MAG: Gfo/Idh/MocA family oxidoreductase [Planctomycetes bacterium]|nr:Gfo/Idh/MocA family oxidoreductase [Planctomycetota bacterium]
MERPRIAVVGVGHLGKHHARLLAGMDELQLVAVVDSREAAVREAAATLGVEGLTDYRELVGRVDAVSVVVPTLAHREVAGFFLEHGCHVLVEKPMTATVAEARELVALAEQRGVVLQVGHIERFNPAFEALRQRGMVPRYIESQRLAPFSFRSTDVGVVLDLMIHDLDLVLALVDSEVESVQAFGGAVFTPREDMASALIKFRNGAVAHLAASRVALKAMRRMRVFSKDGYASIDFSDAQGLLIRKNPGWDFERLPVDEVDTSKIEDLWKYVFEGLLSVERYGGERNKNALREELLEFAGAVRDGRPPSVPGVAGLRAVELAHRVLESIRSHPW